MFRLKSKVISLGAVKQVLLNPKLIVRLPHFVQQLRKYRQMETELGLKASSVRLYPCLDDERKFQPAHNYYFYQDCWAARQVFREKPSYNVDVGSTVLLVGILSQFTKCFSVDIRPIEANLEGLNIVSGSVLDLPFKDNEVPCLTTMCVLEHIGLGRYGDPLNPIGTQDAIREIMRVIKPNGVVIYSVPVGINILEFNANRRFQYEKAATLFKGWEMVDSCVLTPSPTSYISDEMFMEIGDPVACFCMRKPAK